MVYHVRFPIRADCTMKHVVAWMRYSDGIVELVASAPFSVPCSRAKLCLLLPYTAQLGVPLRLA